MVCMCVLVYFFLHQEFFDMILVNNLSFYDGGVIDIVNVVSMQGWSIKDGMLWLFRC
jgi:hypothetical protein